MDIIAIKKSSKWNYKLINLRVKNSKEEINIVDELKTY